MLTTADALLEMLCLILDYHVEAVLTESGNDGFVWQGCDSCGSKNKAKKLAVSH